MSQTEKLTFKIGLSGTLPPSGKRPAFSIWVNDTQYITGAVGTDVEYFTFYTEIEEDREHSLYIRLENKEIGDTTVSEDGTITSDMLLNVESVDIDEIELGVMKWTHSVYTPDDQDISPLKDCINLGWNGRWQLKFTSPFYLWLLDNM